MSTVARRPRAIRAWAVAAALLLAIAWPLASPNAFYVNIGILVVLGAIGAVTLNLIIRTGHVSLAHGAFMGVAAYTCVLLQTRAGVPFLAAMAIGCLASGALALVIGPIILRLTGKYFVLVTFLLGEIVRLVFLEWQSVTGGANGIDQIPAGLDLFKSPVGFYYFCLAVSVLCIGIVWRILCSDLGRAIDAIREADRVAESSGVPVIRIKVMVFVIACMLVGLQGALQAQMVHAIEPASFNMDVSLGMVVMNVLGGMYYLAGPLLGAVFMVALPELLRGYVELQQIIFGIILIVVMAALPGGMIGAWKLARGALARVIRRDRPGPGAPGGDGRARR
ncbi:MULTISPECIES: branched-chain amino acid ABC transporter permease [Alcaligenaceae]|nr:branched-chain amino acid ABC transporter permease [Bordetella genomosp. 10]